MAHPNWTSYLFVYFGPTFDLGHNHSHDASSVGGSEGEELLVGGDVLIPWVWVPGTKRHIVSYQTITQTPEGLLNLWAATC